MACLVDNAGILTITSDPPSSCTGYVLQAASDYNAVTFADLFFMPVTGDIQNAFMAGFGLPVMCYLVSWAYQSVINFAENNRE